jgi:bifunctional DNA-binding transcriptional regulator/antitoxin component of YhaV-PrlF toxin-antitoxin module
MPIVSVDSQRRIYLPKELGFKANKALIVIRGAKYVLITIPEKITEIDIGLSVEELRRVAEERAKTETGDAH